MLLTQHFQLLLQFLHQISIFLNNVVLLCACMRVHVHVWPVDMCHTISSCDFNCSISFFIPSSLVTILFSFVTSSDSGCLATPSTDCLLVLGRLSTRGAFFVGGLACDDSQILNNHTKLNSSSICSNLS